ncbi:MAG TPA: glycosyltransferase, partial [Ilumatobacter sp.]|nr:glycosyltransferase [Ilumatobacter sp.]
METDPQLVPSVVSVMVVHEPGEWFDETLHSLADQDYPNLRSLFLVTPRDDAQLDEMSTRIRQVIPGAFVRPAPGNLGFGPVVNEVLRLVDGDNGFFLLCHDDIALARNTVRVLVAELFRSNAGIVGPKLVDWDEPRLLQHVGLGLDRFGEVDPVVEPGEYDQEQHDAVRDVFVLPSACLLVRADLFRAVGGFDPSITFHGEDVDLCWRAHLTGARVIVVPDARVRHRERLVDRRPDLHHRALSSRHRMRTVATLTGGSRLLVRSIQLVLLTLVELVVGLFTGRFGEALSSLRALGGLIPRSGSIVSRRRAIRGQRAVHEREVLSLQDRGSSRLNSYLRGKETATFVGAESTVRRWREASFGPLLAWFLVVLAIVIGSRSFIRDGVPSVGEFLPYPDSPRDLWSTFRSSFDGRGVGATTANPTGWALLAVASVLSLFRMDLLMTMSVVGMYLLGALGAWRLATVFPVNRARIAGMVVYVGAPLVPGALGRGEWSTLAWFAALPWMVHLARRFVGLEAADPLAAADDLTDGIAPVGPRHRARALAFLTLVVAMTAAFVPVVIVLWPVVALALALGTVLAGGSWRVAGWFVVALASSTGLAFVLNLPWSLGWDWASIVGARPVAPTGRALHEIASLSPTTDRFAVLAVALAVPLLGAVLITRAWRFTWTARAALIVLTFGAVLVAAERGALGVAVPSASMLSVPIALGFALGAAAIVGGFGTDVLGRGFGWRQPVAVIANVAIVVGLVPAVIAIGNGRWHAPQTPLPTLLATQLPLDPAVGDYRVLYVGDPRVLPVPSTDYVDGIAYAVTDAGELDFTDRFFQAETDGDAAVVRALDLVATGSTLRAGRLLAPLGIRYIVIPETDGVASTNDDPLPVANGLAASFQNQLDLGAVYGLPSLRIFANQSWFPVGAQLTGATAEASRLAGDDALVRAELSEATPAMVGLDDGAPDATDPVTPGVLHVAVPFDDRIELSVGASTPVARPGFGLTTAFDIERDGVGTVSYVEDPSRGWWVAAQMVMWVLVLAVAAGARSPFARRRTTAVHDETLIDLDTEPPVGVAGEVLAAWDDAGIGWADEPIEFADDLVAGS